MADWNTPLPAEAVEGADTHVEDHNSIVAAIAEARAAVDALSDSIGALDARAIASGTLAAARIPTLSIGKVSGLQAALDGKADASALADLVTRVEALEPVDG